MKTYKKSDDDQNSNINSPYNYDSNINYSINIRNSIPTLKTNSSNVDLKSMLNQLNNISGTLNINFLNKKANDNISLNNEDVLEIKHIMKY